VCSVVPPLSQSGFKNENAADLLVQLETWYQHDVSKLFGGDMSAALGRITALVRAAHEHGSVSRQIGTSREW